MFFFISGTFLNVLINLRNKFKVPQNDQTKTDKNKCF